MARKRLVRKVYYITDSQVELLLNSATGLGIKDSELIRRIIDLYYQQLNAGRPLSLASPGYTTPLANPKQFLQAARARVSQKEQ